jgi:hypothetical protein
MSTEKLSFFYYSPYGVPDELRRSPEGVLPLRHSLNGEKGKEVYRVPK